MTQRGVTSLAKSVLASTNALNTGKTSGTKEREEGWFLSS